MKQITRDSYQLSTGRMVSANAGIIGLRNPDIERGWEVFEGYDGSIPMALEWEDTFQPWTADERRELADYMLALWGRFKAEADKVVGNTLQKDA